MVELDARVDDRHHDPVAEGLAPRRQCVDVRIIEPAFLTDVLVVPLVGEARFVLGGVQLVTMIQCHLEAGSLFESRDRLGDRASQGDLHGDEPGGVKTAGGARCEGERRVFGYQHPHRLLGCGRRRHLLWDGQDDDQEEGERHGSNTPRLSHFGGRCGYLGPGR